MVCVYACVCMNWVSTCVVEGADVVVCTRVEGWLGEHYVHGPRRCWS